MTKFNLLKLTVLFTSLCATLYVPTSFACTRVVYTGPKNIVLAARSLDWGGPIGTNLWVFPRGMQRDAATGKDSMTWKAKYGSIVASAFDAATADGMNEKGLVANLLYLAESQYPTAAEAGKSKPMSIAVWAQYVLDNFATVAEAVTELEKNTIYIVPVMTPDGHPGQVHLAISDQSGDSAIFEYEKGKLVVHHGKQYNVMTNSPFFEQQLALNTYWQEIGGETMLPGTSRAADRFARASYYVGIAPQTDDIVLALSSIFSVIRNASAPYGVSEPGKPNIATTLWRVVSDQKNLRYYYESTSSPNIFWIDFKDLNFNEDQKASTLKVSNGEIYTGNAAKQFQPATPFTFLMAKPK